MWPSIVFQPMQLAKSMVGARVWERVIPLMPHERIDYTESAAPLGERAIPLTMHRRSESNASLSRPPA
jgi:hypothetical protein